MKKYVPFLFLVIGLIVSCTTSEQEESTNQNGTTAQTQDQQPTGQELAHKFIIVDGHIDVPYRLKSEWEDVSKATDDGNFDYPRAKEGGLNAPFMSIYIPTEYQKSGGAKALADSLIDMVYKIAEKHHNKFAMATSPKEIQQNFNDSLISFAMGMENGAPIGSDLSNIQYFYNRGIRYITLTHGKDNKIGDSSYDNSHTHGGLTDFGKKVVKEMNRVGIMVDVSHISDDTFYDVMEVSEAPVIASHSSARHFTPGFERNMNDEMIKLLAKNNGVIMVNFGSDFLDEETRENSEGLRDRIMEKIKAEGLEPGSDEAKKRYKELHEQEYHFSDVQKVADHIDHIVDLVGIDHVGIGSDFDGVGNTLPVGLKDVSAYPNLFDELLDRGYSPEDIQQIASGNVFRVWNNVAEVADKLADE